MSTELLIGIIGVGLCFLFGIAVTMQKLEKHRAEKKRLLSSLNARIRNFEYILNGFPSGFLSSDLQILVCKSLQEVYTQLLNLSPHDKRTKDASERVNQILASLSKRGATDHTVVLTNNVQIREIQNLLKNLFNFIGKLSQRQRITDNEAKIYAGSIRKLILQTSIDAINMAIAAAKQAGKFPLAIHHLNSAINKLSKENHKGIYDEKISSYQQQIESVNAIIGKTSLTPKTEQKEHDKEWEELKKPDDSWKKKAIYD